MTNIVLVYKVYLPHDVYETWILGRLPGGQVCHS